MVVKHLTKNKVFGKIQYIRNTYGTCETYVVETLKNSQMRCSVLVLKLNVVVCRRSSIGRVLRCQRSCCEFDSRRLLHVITRTYNHIF